MRKLFYLCVLALPLCGCDSRKDQVSESSIDEKNMKRTVRPDRERKPSGQEISDGAGDPVISHGYFSDREIRQQGVDDILETIASLDSEDEREDAALEAVSKLGASDVEKLLELMSGLPIGKESARALSAAMRRIAKEHPYLWIDDRTLLENYLTKGQMDTISYSFGKSLAKVADPVALIDRIYQTSDPNSSTTHIFVEALFEEMDPKNSATACSVLAKVGDHEKVQALSRKPKLFAPTVTKNGYAEKLIQDAPPEARGKMAGAVGGVFAELGFEKNGEIHALGNKMSPTEEEILFTNYFDRLSEKDLNKTLNKVNEIPKSNVRDAVIMKLLSRIKYNDPGAAVLWIDQISNEGEKMKLKENSDAD